MARWLERNIRTGKLEEVSTGSVHWTSFYGLTIARLENTTIYTLHAVLAALTFMFWVIQYSLIYMPTGYLRPWEKKFFEENCFNKLLDQYDIKMTLMPRRQNQLILLIIKMFTLDLRICRECQCYWQYKTCERRIHNKDGTHLTDIPEYQAGQGL